jgi:hypothetical protein
MTSSYSKNILNERIVDNSNTSQLKINEQQLTEEENVTPSRTKASIVKKKDSAKFDFQSSKKILFYNDFFKKEDFYFGLGNDPFVSRNCPVQNCFTTSNKSLLGKKINARFIQMKF